MEWPTQTNFHETQSFMGIAGYYCRFVEGLSKIGSPITRHQRENKKFNWMEAIVYALNVWRHHLLSRKFDRRTDHCGL